MVIYISKATSLQYTLFLDPDLLKRLFDKVVENIKNAITIHFLNSQIYIAKIPNEHFIYNKRNRELK